MTVTDHNDRPSAAKNSPAITPADLAKLISGRLGEGFQPKPAPRSGRVNEGGEFVAADYRLVSSAGDLKANAVSRPEVIAAQPPVETSVTLKAPPSTAAPEGTRDHQEELRAAFLRGLEEGREQGRLEAQKALDADAENDLQKARALFVSAAHAIQNPPAEATTDLSLAISRAVARLASDRAGLAITDHPDAFMTRIQAMADRVSQGVREVTIHLNAEDLELVKKHLAGNSDSIPNLVVSKRLGRGDVEVRSNGISLTDKLECSIHEDLA